MIDFLCCIIDQDIKKFHFFLGRARPLAAPLVPPLHSWTSILVAYLNFNTSDYVVYIADGVTNLLERIHFG